MGKQAENIINRKADLVFAESRRTGKMIPQSLQNIYGKCLLFIVALNISQLHRQHLSYNVNKVEPVPAVLPHSRQRPTLLPNIRKDHYTHITTSNSPTPQRKLGHTGLSPQAADLFFDSPMAGQSSSHSSGTKRKMLPHPNKEDGSSSNIEAIRDESSSATTP